MRQCTPASQHIVGFLLYWTQTEEQKTGEPWERGYILPTHLHNSTISLTYVIATTAIVSIRTPSALPSLSRPLICWKTFHTQVYKISLQMHYFLLKLIHFNTLIVITFHWGVIFIPFIIILFFILKMVMKGMKITPQWKVISLGGLLGLGELLPASFRDKFISADLNDPFQGALVVPCVQNDILLLQPDSLQSLDWTGKLDW